MSPQTHPSHRQHHRQSADLIPCSDAGHSLVDGRRAVGDNCHQPRRLPVVSPIRPRSSIGGSKWVTQDRRYADPACQHSRPAVASQSNADEITYRYSVADSTQAVAAATRSMTISRSFSRWNPDRPAVAALMDGARVGVSRHHSLMERTE
jgi:hypothetical protein